MAEEKESLLGRKVFFTNPSYTLRNLVMPELRDLEFEVYDISDYRYIRNYLHHFPDCILLVNIDSQLNIFSWYGLIETIQEDAEFKGVTVGILSDHITDKDRDMFLTRLDIKAGAIATSGDSRTITESVADILTFHNAKGRRQHVRVNCMQDKDAAILWTTGSKMFQMKMLDISVVGSALLVPANQLGTIDKNSVVRDATIKIGAKNFPISFLVYDIHAKGDKMLLITIFLPNTADVVKQAIKEYVNKALEQQMRGTVNGEEFDATDYIALGKYYSDQFKNEEEAEKHGAILDKKDREREK